VRTSVGLSSPLLSWKPLSRDAIMQPLKPQIMPSARILQLAAERDTDLDSTD
jgi:hypothetical protein